MATRARSTDAAVALVSGGLDSGVAAALWREQGGSLAACLFCHYGQRAAQPERAASRALAARFGAPWHELALPWLGELARVAGSALADEHAALPEGTQQAPGDERSAAAVWVPARNAVFVSAAAAWAEAHGVGSVITGFNREEAATFADNSAAFVAAGNAFLALGTRNAVRIESPTLALDKAGIVAAARRLGFGPQDFWSCYRGDQRPCGRCESCVRSSRAWAP